MVELGVPPLPTVVLGTKVDDSSEILLAGCYSDKLLYYLAVGGGCCWLNRLGWLIAPTAQAVCRSCSLKRGLLVRFSLLILLKQYSRPLFQDSP